MRRLFYILCSFMLAASVCNTMEAQSLMQTAKKAEQRAKELKHQETSRYDAIIDSKDLSKYTQYIADYPRGSKTQEIRNRIEELKLWNTAKSSNTIAGYESYLNSTKYHWYDTDANSAIRLLKQKAEKQAWDEVVAVNTIDAYEQYLQQNPNSGYRLDAEKEINRLKGTIEWKKINGTNNIAELQKFISSYPHSKEIVEASILLHELKGVQYYIEGNLGSAYTEFSKLSIEQISPENRNAYNDVMEYNNFQKLGIYASEGDLLSFITKHPNGKYYNQACNNLAITRARNLDEYSSDSDYVRALSYAKDEETKELVQSYITNSKKLKSDKAKAFKSYLRDQNGGIFNLGFDFLDMGYNFGQQILYYNLGLILRIGNYKDLLQFAIGVYPGVMRYPQQYDDNDFYSDNYSVGNITFHLPILCHLKLNLVKLSENSRLFIYGIYQYNAIRKKYLEGEFAWGVGCGFAWKHFDWSLYFRKDTGRIINSDFASPNFWGMSMIYYWQL